MQSYGFFMTLQINSHIFLHISYNVIAKLGFKNQFVRLIQTIFIARMLYSNRYWLICCNAVIAFFCPFWAANLK